MRVAFVCDAGVSRVLFNRLVTALGHEVSSIASSGAGDGGAGALDSSHAALVAAIGATLPDLVIVDGHVGDPRGTRSDGSSRAIRLVAAVRSGLPGVTVGVVAALSETALVRAAGEAGVRVVVPRPLLASGVRAALASVCAKGRSPLP